MNTTQTPLTTPRFQFCDSKNPPMTITAYRAGYALGEVARETGGEPLVPMPTEVEDLYNSEYIDGVERDLIEDAFNDGAEAGYCGREPLTDTQICIHYD